MRTRTAAFAALALALPLAACTNPGGGGPPKVKDCGRIDVNNPSNTDRAAVDCYNTYHLPPFPSVQLVTTEKVNGSTITRTFKTPGVTHKVTITTVTTTAAGVTTTKVQECGVDGSPFNAGKGQTFIDGNGRIVLQSC
jgi:hypothetical protein